MRCPKCGSFLEEGKSKCFMCGFDVNQDTGATQSANFNNSTNGFSTGSSGFSTGMNNTGANNSNSDYLVRKEAYMNRMNDYRNVDYSAKKGDKKDLIDIYSAHKTLYRVILLGIVIILGIFIGRGIYLHKTAPEVLTPKLGKLYYEVDSSFTNTNVSNDQMVYTKSGSKGTSCSISISTGSNSTGDHVSELYTAAKKKLAPETDRDGNILDQNEVFSTSDNKQVINDFTWYYMNVWYRSDLSKENSWDLLKYQYYTSMFDGYYYDIELVLNNGDDTVCTSSIKNFINSLKFISE